jgi:selenoprotein W-related protein
LAASLKHKYGVDAKLIRGERGIFDVVVDSRKVFSKHEVGRFPEDREVFDAIDRARR